MKQLFYIAVIVVLMIIAHRVMSKVKDPEEDPVNSEEFTEDDPTQNIEMSSETENEKKNP